MLKRGFWMLRAKLYHMFGSDRPKNLIEGLDGIDMMDNGIRYFKWYC